MNDGLANGNDGGEGCWPIFLVLFIGLTLGYLASSS